MAMYYFWGMEMPTSHFKNKVCAEFSAENTFVLVDGSGFIFRAFYAIPHLTTSNGFPTNALFGYTRMLGKLLNDLSPERCVVIFDAARENFRHQIYDAYKANRDQMPDSLKPQIPYFAKISEAIGLQTYKLEGYEADDLIGTLAQSLNAIGGNVIIVTGDKDLAQLVNSRTVIFDPMKDAWFDEAAVFEKYGVAANQFVDYLALLGDASDNIPGVKGIGPKSAAALLQHFGSVQGVVSRVGEIRELKGLRGKEKLEALISESCGQLEVSYQLAQIKCDIDLQEIFQQDMCADDLYSLLQRGQPNAQLVNELSRDLEFADLLGSLAAPQVQIADSNSDFVVHVVLEDCFDDFLGRLEEKVEWCFDLETTSLDFHEAQIVGVSFCLGEDEGFYIPCGHRDSEGQLVTGQVHVERLCDALRPYFENPSIRKVGQNLKYDCSILYTHGVSVKGLSFDTMLAAYLLSPDSPNFRLEVLAREYLNYGCVSYSDVVGDLESFAFVSLDAAAHYAAEDAVVAWRLRTVLEPKLREARLERVFHEIEMPLVDLLARMEMKGVLLDISLLQQASEEWGEELFRLEQELYGMVGHEFNVNSTKQLSKILFEDMSISTKGVKRTKTGFSTDSSVLEKLAPFHEVPRLVLEYRLLNKLRTTYVDALPKQVASTGRIHSSFRQTGTGTGRLSSSDPNLQNIPIATAQGRRIRQAFVAPRGYAFVAADYSQIELRILAHLSGDERLISAFRDGLDIHEQTAREILGVSSTQEVSKAQRRLGKTINFGIIYGMGAYRLGQELGIPFGEARSYIQRYFDRYPGVSRFFDECKKAATEQGEVRTLFGRRRLISELTRASSDKGFLERVAMNAPIQGSAADIVKLAMIRVDAAIKSASCPAELVLQIHDELIYELPEQDVGEFQRLLGETMSSVLVLAVPLEVEVSTASSWNGLG
jgi:DNA polymerase-1